MLIVEDESIVRLHLQRAMEALGHEIVGAVATAQEAVETATARRPDLVLMDIQLGRDRSGIDAAAQLHAKSDAAIVFVTAFADERTVQATENAGAVGYLVKPFSEPELRAVITTALATRQRTRQLRSRERSLSHVLSSGDRGVIVANDAGVVTFANAVAAGAVDRSPRELFGHPLGEALRLTGEPRAEFDALLARVPDEEEAVPFEARVQHRGGIRELRGELLQLFSEGDTDANVAFLFDASPLTPAPAGRIVEHPRLLIYSHDTFGLGHLRRSLNIAGALVEEHPRLSVLVVTGSAVVHRFKLPPRVDYVKLPAVRKVASDRYESRSLLMSGDSIAEFRSGLLLKTAQDFDPHVLLVDHSPSGMSGELLPTLKWLGEERPNCAKVIGLRDVIDEPQRVIDAWKRDGIYELLRDEYDHVMVYGMREIYDLVREYRLPAALAERAAFVNYVVEEDGGGEPPAAATHGRPHVLVTIGGGDGAGELVVATFLELMSECDDGGFRATVVTGPLIDPGLMESFRRRAAGLKHLELVEFVESTSSLMRSADVVVCTGGYNTCAQALRYGRSVIVVPRIEHRQEQWVRASRLRDLGMLGVIHPSELSPSRLLAELRSQLEAGPRAQVRCRSILRFDGARQVARAAHTWFARARVVAHE